MIDEQRAAALAIARAMTAGDLSILRAALEELGRERPTLLTTSPGSPNDRLWSAMVALGWMRAAEPPDIPVPSRLYVVDPAAKDRISDFLAENSRAEAMTAIVNDLRSRIPPIVIDAVRGADGVPSDLAIALAGIVEMTMRRAIRPELHEEFLLEVAKVAQAMRSI
jgi:hypothetical protein